MEDEVRTLEATRNTLLEQIGSLGYSLKCFDSGENCEACCTGYKLSNFNLHERGNEKKYEASCPGQFRLVVTEVAGTVTDLQVSVMEGSDLLEIKCDLDELQKERCPHRLLTVIQQYIHMSDFRNHVFHQLRNSVASVVRLYEPQRTFLEEGKHRIRLYRNCSKKNVILDVQWTMHWNEMFQSLIHHFIFIHIDSSCPKALLFSEKLKEKIFHCYNPSILWDSWQKLCDELKSQLL